MIALNNINDLNSYIRAREKSPFLLFQLFSIAKISLRVYFGRRKIIKTLALLQSYLVSFLDDRKVGFTKEHHKSIRSVLGTLKSIQFTLDETTFVSDDIKALLSSNIETAYKVERIIRQKLHSNKEHQNTSELGKSLSQISVQNISTKDYDSNPA